MTWRKIFTLLLRNTWVLAAFAAIYAFMTHYPSWKVQLGLQVSDGVLFAGLLAWGFCMGAAYEAARIKKRSTWEWLLVATLFGPLALLALAALGPEGTACASCDTVYRKDAARCPVCNEPASGDWRALQLPAGPAPSETRGAQEARQADRSRARLGTPRSGA
jgi:RNA polymerase subunit RPABC4/transcription elongation factor Spt4